MAIAVEPGKHAEFTRRWMENIPKKGKLNWIDYSKLNPAKIMEIARKVYYDAPEILQNLPNLPL